jgi:hypothetical protein
MPSELVGQKKQTAATTVAKRKILDFWLESFVDKCLLNFKIKIKTKYLYFTLNDDGIAFLSL